MTAREDLALRVDSMSDEVSRIFEEETEGGRRHTWFELCDDCIKFLDQRYLPLREEWGICRDERDVALCIKNMVVRGAPAIGISAAFGVWLGLKKRVEKGQKVDYKVFCEIKNIILDSRPTAYNLFRALQDMEEEFVSSQDSDLVERMRRKALEIWFLDFKSCYLIGKNGAQLIPDEGTVFTICNTGSLATGGWGTAFSAIKYAVKKLGKDIEVISLETRPFLQGARLTTWELIREKIKFKLIVDSASAFVMSKSSPHISCVLTGADRILKDGTVSNKIGTLMLAILSKHFSIPFYVLAPKTTIDVSSDTIPLEQRAPREVKEIFGVKITHDETNVINYVFDITPPELISSIITEDGIFRYPYSF